MQLLHSNTRESPVATYYILKWTLCSKASFSIVIEMQMRYYIYIKKRQFILQIISSLIKKFHSSIDDSFQSIWNGLPN